MNQLPPLIRRRHVLEVFRGIVTEQELAKWVAAGTVQTFRRTPQARPYYVTASIERLVNIPPDEFISKPTR